MPSHVLRTTRFRPQPRRPSVVVRQRNCDTIASLTPASTHTYRGESRETEAVHKENVLLASILAATRGRLLRLRQVPSRGPHYAMFIIAMPTLLVLASDLSAGEEGPSAPIRIDRPRRQVTIATSRYALVFRDGLFVSLHSRLTGEPFCSPTQIDFAAPSNQPYAAGLIVDARGRRRRWVDSESVFAVKPRSATEVTVEYTGLNSMSGRTDADVVAFHLAVDLATEDLLISMSCRTATPGISDLVFSFPYLRNDVRCIVPQFWGNVLHAEDFPQAGQFFRWPDFSNGLRFQVPDPVRSLGVLLQAAIHMHVRDRRMLDLCAWWRGGDP